MGYSPWDHKELDTTEQINFPQSIWLPLSYMNILKRFRKTTEWKGQGMSSGELEKSREHFIQGWA